MTNAVPASDHDALRALYRRMIDRAAAFPRPPQRASAARQTPRKMLNI